MKKQYVQPEFEAIKLSSLNDFLNTIASPETSLEGGAGDEHLGPDNEY